MPLEFRLLGDLEVRVDGRRVELGHHRQRCVLAVLLVEAGRRVSIDQLLDRVWGHHPPRHGRDTLYSYLSRLRRMLAAVDGARIAWQSGGYVISVDPMTVDVHRFQRWVGEARTAADPHARHLLEQALALWSGDALANLDTPWLNTLREGLVQQRHAAELDLTDVHLRSGRHAELVPALTIRAARHPLDERLAGQLMLALYRSGRPAEALRHYQRIRLHLVEELGADPGPSLQDLHRRILTADPTTTPPASTPATLSGPPGIVPRQLPAPPARFTGRRAELGQLSRALDESGRPGGTVVISSIGGIGGIGKTWLALRWAHENIDRFPDGQLFANLRGFDPIEQPTSPVTAVRGFLEALGVDPQGMPTDLDAQVGLYRSLVAGRRMLIVLDNVRDADQAAPLLPGSPTCTVVVTSRHQLAGMTAVTGTRPVALDALDDAEAHELLLHRLGADRLAAEPEAVAYLLACCAGLPLALAVLAARAVLSPQLPLAALAVELWDTTDRLDAWDSGDLRTNLRAVFTTSYLGLSAQASEVFGLLGLAPGPDIGLGAVAALTGLAPARVRGPLRELEGMSLIHQHTPGRWRMHDLVRLYAAEQAGEDQPETARQAALRRLVDFHLHTAYAAERLLAPHRTPIKLGDPAPGWWQGPPADHTAAWTWFADEHACLLATQRLAAKHNWHEAVWQLAWSLDTFHFRRGTLQDQFDDWLAGLEAARHLDDPEAQMLAHRVLGHACARLGRHGPAMDHFQQALTLAQRTGDLAAQAQIHQGLAMSWAQREDLRQALEHTTQALHRYRALDDPVQTADALNDMGWYASRLGLHTEGLAHCEAALALFRRHRHRDGEANTLDSLGYIAHHTGRYDQALSYYNEALRLLQEIGNAFDEANTLEHLGDVHATIGDQQQARNAWCQALRLYRTQNRAEDADRVQRRSPAV
ncbi:tetratricopeptide repeat protein [Microtetraspora sp. AC03309]|uniref:AfsR/SARP family transcriptional regulator n=1 Tax=Microtetraspora sp. AC03309 TaxID=2779376 RepID=UPI001E53773A|nr:BTAD domain-containing putative transcriptional regulator [Microtetraspora sp. AC03309]MCC5579604.1 tetratricopeptide repeat protein [Microtetraspora sp. AC03309]